MSETGWYIVKKDAALPCEILSEAALIDDNAPLIEKWGPFETRNQALAKRVGLIRVGKCRPSE